jgi:hypothetical protein
MQFTALRTIGGIYKVLAIVVGIVTVLIALGLGSTFGFLAMVGALVYGGGIGLTLYAAGEAVYLLLALEENTRLTATLLQRQINAAPPMQPASNSLPLMQPASSSPLQVGPVLHSQVVGRGGQVQPRE